MKYKAACLPREILQKRACRECQLAMSMSTIIRVAPKAHRTQETRQETPKKERLINSTSGPLGRLVLKVTLFLLLHCTGVFLCFWGVLTRLD